MYCCIQFRYQLQDDTEKHHIPALFYKENLRVHNMNYHSITPYLNMNRLFLLSHHMGKYCLECAEIAFIFKLHDNFYTNI